MFYCINDLYFTSGSPWSDQSDKWETHFANPKARPRVGIIITLNINKQ